MKSLRLKKRITMNKKNLLLVFSDQHRRQSLGCYGNKEVKSPHLDKLARDGLKLNRCYSNSPVCVPARGSLLTGTYPLKHGAATNDLPVRPSVESLAHVLNRAGYATGYIGKWHLAGVPREQAVPEGPGRLGFREWKACNCNHNYLDAWFYDEDNKRNKVEGYEPETQTDMALDFISRHAHGDAPWGLVLSWGPPHDPYDKVPERYKEMYRNLEPEIRPNVPETTTNYIKDYVPPQHRKWMKETLSRADIEQNYRGYYAHITALDEQFGRLMDRLEETGQLGDTLVVYTSDHGDMIGSQGLTNKQLPYEESVGVPLIIYGDGLVPPGERDDLIGLVDLPVTLAGLLGLAFDGRPDGLDLSAMVRGKGGQRRDSCYLFDLVPCHQAAFRGSSAWRGVTTGRYTFARGVHDKGYLLFDNDADPFQQNNLIDDPRYTSVQKELLARCDEYIGLYDELIDPEELIVKNGFREEWNKSQAFFDLPLIEKEHHEI